MSRIVFVAGNARSLIANRGDLIVALRQLEHEVIALVPAYDALPELSDLGIPYELVRLNRSSLDPLRDMRSLHELKCAIRRLVPDIVFSYTIKPVIYGTLAARWAGISRVTSMITGLGYLFSGESARQRAARLIAQRLYAFALPMNDAVFFQNPDDLETFRNSGLLRADQHVVLVNGSGINLDRFAPIALPNGPPRFLLIARLLQDKGITEFVEAASILKHEHPEAEFEVLGPHDPNLPHALSLEQVEQWRASGIVTFRPAVKDVRPYLAACSVYVLPSYREGTPRTVLEAMATGRAIITSDAPGCRETVVPGVNGFLVPPRDSAALAEAMRRFVLDPELAISMGRESRRISETKYDVELVNKVMIRHLLGTEGTCEAAL
jgi:glycosyltransferase involved in cell wall biosynthesis